MKRITVSFTLPESRVDEVMDQITSVLDRNLVSLHGVIQYDEKEG